MFAWFERLHIIGNIFNCIVVSTNVFCEILDVNDFVNHGSNSVSTLLN